MIIYSASTLHFCRDAEGLPLDHVLETIYLIAAADRDSAGKLAIQLGRNAEHHYKNLDDKYIYWDFAAFEIKELDSPGMSSASAEVFSRFVSRQVGSLLLENMEKV